MRRRLVVPMERPILRTAGGVSPEAGVISRVISPAPSTTRSRSSTPPMTGTGSRWAS